MNIVGISGNLARPSRTRTLVDTILAEINERGLGTTRSFDLVDAGPDIGASLSREGASERVDRILSAIEHADVLIAASPVYKASYTGLFKHLFDLIDPKALEGQHVLLAATGGSDRHALVIEHQLRPLFSFFGAHILPLSLYATDADFANSTELLPTASRRVTRAVDQFAGLAPRLTKPARLSLLQSVA